MTRPMLRRMSTAAGALALVALGVACAQILGFQDLTGPDGGVTEAGADTGPNPTGKCGLRWPEAPSADDPNGRADAGGENGYVLVVSQLGLLNALDGGAATFGYDMHCRTTTGDPATSSCVAPQRALANLADRDGGVDNNGAPALASVANLGTTIKDSAFNTPIQAGTSSLLLRLYGYNGAKDDTFVTFGILGAPGTRLVDGGTHPIPKFDGNDEWYVDSNDVKPFSYKGPTLLATRAYVRDGMLVAFFDQAVHIQLATPFGNLRADVDSAVMTARLVVDAQRDVASLEDGVLSGRWRTSKVFEAVGNLSISGVSLCPSALTVAQSVCGYVDLASAGENDGGKCDSLSVALQFKAAPARLGPDLDAGVYTNQCPAPGDCPP